MQTFFRFFNDQLSKLLLFYFRTFYFKKTTFTQNNLQSKNNNTILQKGKNFFVFDNLKF